MDRFLRILFALLVAIGATAAELRMPTESVRMDCPMSADGTCPCGMPMPERGPQPCGPSIPSPLAEPTRSVTVVTASATAADQALPEALPWPRAWMAAHCLAAERERAAEPLPVDTGPPLLASERIAALRVFRI